MARETIMSKFAIFLKEKRLAMGLSQENLAIMLYDKKNMTGYISKIESQKLHVSVKTMDYILEKLNSSIEFIE
ncbi:MAG: hypothetical protein RL311_824 [Bacteroidota bacterium]|jgi:transcriptional regulator with XRE-family HTH domain